MTIFEWIDSRGRGAFTEWYNDRTVRQKAAIDAKLKVVRQVGQPTDGRANSELPPNMFRGPVKGHFYKFTVNCDGALRPLAFKGLVDSRTEWTFLIGAAERDGKMVPATCYADAEIRRLEILADISKRQEVPNDDE